MTYTPNEIKAYAMYCTLTRTPKNERKRLARELYRLAAKKPENVRRIVDRLTAAVKEYERRCEA